MNEVRVESATLRALVYDDVRGILQVLFAQDGEVPEDIQVEVVDDVGAQLVERIREHTDGERAGACGTVLSIGMDQSN